jgi:hypothetical protein
VAVIGGWVVGVEGNDSRGSQVIGVFKRLTTFVSSLRNWTSSPTMTSNTAGGWIADRAKRNDAGEIR